MERTKGVISIDLLPKAKSFHISNPIHEAEPLVPPGFESEFVFNGQAQTMLIKSSLWNLLKVIFNRAHLLL